MNIQKPDKTNEVPNPEQVRLETEWRESAELQKEYPTSKAYAAYMRNNTRAQIYERTTT